MLNDLDDTLEQMLISKKAKEILGDIGISFQTPDSSLNSQAPLTLNLFLYELKENRSIRESFASKRIVKDKFHKFRPPIYLDCTYLVTAWSSQNNQKVKREHELLGKALAWLHQFPEVNPKLYQGDLKKQSYPIHIKIAELEGTTTEFWTALSISPRPAFTLVATLAISLPEFKLENEPFAVKTSEVVIGKFDGKNQELKNLEQGFHIGGTVTVENDIGVADVTLLLREIGLITKTDEQGRFKFSGIVKSEYTLVISGENIKLKEKKIQVPSQNYDVSVTRSVNNGSKT